MCIATNKSQTNWRLSMKRVAEALTVKNKEKGAEG